MKYCCIAVPHERVTNPDYFRAVMKNMEWVRDQDNRQVRFGLTGDGIAPNYQTSSSLDDKNVRRYDGKSHKVYHADPLKSFDDDRLSRTFGWEEVQAMLRPLYKGKKA